MIFAVIRCVSMSEHLYHLIGEKDWAGLKGQANYSPESLSKEGFIHLSLLRQIPGVVERFYSTRRDLMVMLIDRKKLQSPVRFESADNDQFPHLYGPLNLDAVIEVQPLHKLIPS